MTHLANSRLDGESRVWAQKMVGELNIGGKWAAKAWCVWGSGESTTAGVSGCRDRFNRQLNPDDKQKLAQLQKGKTPEEQQRLTDAACYLVQCAAQLSSNDPAQAAALASQQRGAEYVSEQQDLKSTGLFVYSRYDMLNDPLAAMGDWGDQQVKSAGRGAMNMADEFAGLVKANNGHTPPTDPNNQLLGENDGHPPATGGAVVTPPLYAMTPEGPVPVSPGIVAPGTPILSSGNGSSDSGSAPATRPSPPQSEIDVGTDLGPGHNPQVSYLNGQQVPYGTPGSVRPDFVAADGTASFEVKNYNIATNSSGLINNVARQAIQRADNLPDSMRQQVVIDVRGQDITPQQIATIRQGVALKSNGIIGPSSIRFKTQ